MTTSKQRRASFAAIALMAVLAMVLASGCRRRRHYERHQSSDPRRVLTGAEITKLFAGKTVQGDHLKKHYYFRSYYDPNGTFRSYQQGSKTARNGKWRVRGDEICVQWGSDPSELCRQMVAGEGGTYWKVKVKPDGRKINIVMYKTFIQGNKADPAGGGATTAAAAGTAAAGTAAGSGEPAAAGAAAATTAGGSAGGTATGAPPAAATKKGAATPLEKPTK